MLTRRALLSAALAAVPGTLLMSRPALAATPRTFAENGLAIRGADPVAFFTQGAAVAGSADFELLWNGAMWRFASVENMERFMGNAYAYAPQYGGYCAFALSNGEISATVPEAWTIVDDKLYLKNSLAVRTIWSEDIPENIASADSHWPSVLS